MSRRHLTFACDGDRLTGTLDEAAGIAGLLIVSGGNETRAGAFSGQAELAGRIAAAGFPVFRFDRRGVGDSEGENLGFRHNVADIAAALSAFRTACPELKAVVGFGNCDAASALMLSRGTGLEALALANPWTIEHDDGTPPPEAVRSRYAEKLRNPKEVWRLLTGKVSFGKLADGIRHALRSAPPSSGLADEVAAGLAGFRGNSVILLASRDRTAQVFESCWNAADPRIRRCAGATHAFAEAQSRDWLVRELLALLRTAA